MRLRLRIASLALLGGVVIAQEGGWKSGQVNATMCQWQEPRVGVIRDTVYIDGGYLWWEPGMSDGTYGAPTQDGRFPSNPSRSSLIKPGNPNGLVYVLNFSTPFNTARNMSSFFTRISKAPNGGAANNFAQNFYDGTMFANDGEWYTYGGMVSATSEFSPPAANAVEGYEQYWYGSIGKKFSPGFIGGTLPSNITRYITSGGGVNVPSENKGYYFSGLRAPGSGPIFYTTGNATTDPTVISDRLITIDMSNQQNETWSNKTLPPTVPGRANPELVWIPQGKQGLLVAIGGVIDPEYAYASQSLNATQMAQSQTESPKFMSTVSVYDIANDTWYSQATSGQTPPALTQGCTVVASAQDYSSHSIYWYGGFDGIDPSTPLSDDVYVLSLPSFIWVRALSGNSTHGRAGHKCVKPYPDTMFVIGGYPQYTNGDLSCLENNGIIQVFNLSNPQWLTTYDPAVWSNYTIPSMITNKIGGSGTGGANTNPSSWNDPSLASVFAASNTYDTSKIKKWYPYNSSATNTSNPRVPESTTPSSSGGGLPKWVPPVLGVVLGLVFLSAVLVIFLLWRRRHYLRSHPDEMTNTTDLNRYRIANWVRGAGAEGLEAKAPTVTSSEENPDLDSPHGDSSGNTHVTSNESAYASGHPVVEAAGTQVHEMMDTSRPQEMAAEPSTTGTGFSYFAPTGSGKSNLKKDKNHTLKSSKHRSQASSSTVSEVSSPVVSPTSIGRPDSPSLGAGAVDIGVIGDNRVVSGVSATSTDRGILSRLSQDHDGSMNPHGVAIMPSPPTPQGIEGGDYVSHGGSGNPNGASPLTPGSAVSSPSSPGSVASNLRPGAGVARNRGVSGSGSRRSNFGEHLDES